MKLNQLVRKFKSLKLSLGPHDDKTSPATSFTQFPNLPAELQAIIWDFALATPTVISVEPNFLRGGYLASTVSRSLLGSDPAGPHLLTSFTKPSNTWSFVRFDQTRNG